MRPRGADELNTSEPRDSTAAAEEIQLSVGDAVRVYVVDQSTGRLTEDATREPLAAAPDRMALNELFDGFGR